MCKCKICGSDRVSEFVDSDFIKYKGKELSILMHYSECGECGREFISKEQILKNELIIREAKKKHDGLLSNEEIINARRKLKITQEEAAKIFGGGRNAFSKYERGEVSQSVAMDKLIRLCLDDRAVFNKLAKDSGVTLHSNGADWVNVIFYSDYKKPEKAKLKSSSCIPLGTGEVSYGF